MTTIAIKEEQDAMSEDKNTMTKSTIQIQCHPSHHILTIRGVETTRLVQDATFTLRVADVIVDMTVTADIPDPETETAGTITGTIVTTNQEDEATKGPAAAGSITGMITST